MDHTIPPSPAPSTRERSFSTVSQLSQHRGLASRSRCSTTPEVTQFDSLSASRYQTSRAKDLNQNSSTNMAYPQPHQGMSFHYEGLRPSDDSSAYEIAHSSSAPQVYNLNTPEASPPTVPQQLVNNPIISGVAGSQRASHGIKALAVKSGRIEKSSPQKKKPVSVSTSPPATRKDKSAKTSSGDAESIKQPLSVLAKDWDIPVVDIEAYVSRSADERREEVDRGKIPGKVKRAMNAFMLYRKAYQDGAKKWAQQSNHQVVSKICGLSWSMEPENVRLQFNNWAVIERDNHRLAHPEYKFTPSKPRKKGKEGFEEDSDAEETAWEHTGKQDAKYRSTDRTPMIDQHGSSYGYQYATPHIPDTQAYISYHQGLPLQAPGLTRNTPIGYDADEYASGAMQCRQFMNNHQNHVDSVAYTNTAQHNIGPLPPTHYTASQQNLDASVQYHSQLGSHSLSSVMPSVPTHGNPQVSFGQQIDPSLMSRDAMPQYDISNPVLASGSLGESQWPSGFQAGADTAEMYAGPYMDVEESFVPDSHLQYLHGDDESWRGDSIQRN